LSKKIIISKTSTGPRRKMRGEGIKATQKIYEKNEMLPVTFVGSLCKTHAALCSKIAYVHEIEVCDARTWKIVYFKKCFWLLLHIMIV